MRAKRKEGGLEGMGGEGDLNVRGGGGRERTKALREREEKDGGMGFDKYPNKMILFQRSRKESEDYCISIIEDL